MATEDGDGSLLSAADVAYLDARYAPAAAMDYDYITDQASNHLGTHHQAYLCAEH